MPIDEELLERIKRDDPTLKKEVYLVSKNLVSRDAIDLAKALEIHTSVTSINLADNHVGDEGAEAIAEVLKRNTSITSINLDNNQIGPTGAKALAKALKINTSLTSMSFSRNQMGAAGAKAFAEALKVNASLTSISFIYNQIGPRGAKALAESLKTNTKTSVAWIYLRGNKIGDVGVKALAESLKTNTSVTWIYLADNQISDEGVEAFAGALKINTSLTWIDLAKNEISNTGAEALAEALQENTSVMYIYYYDNKISGDAQGKMNAFLRRNNTLTQSYQEAQTAHDKALALIKTGVKRDEVLAAFKIAQAKAQKDLHPLSRHLLVRIERDLKAYRRKKHSAPETKEEGGGRLFLQAIMQSGGSSTPAPIRPRVSTYAAVQQSLSPLSTPNPSHIDVASSRDEAAALRGDSKRSVLPPTHPQNQPGYPPEITDLSLSR